MKQCMVISAGRICDIAFFDISPIGVISAGEGVSNWPSRDIQEECELVSNTLSGKNVDLVIIEHEQTQIKPVDESHIFQTVRQKSNAIIIGEWLYTKDYAKGSAISPEKALLIKVMKTRPELFL
jgi:hypothetical protein